MANASAEDLRAFVAQISPGSYPFWDNATNDVTFLHFVPGAEPDVGVHLWINRVTDKDRFAIGVMENIGGGLFALTLNLPPTLRASYGFTEFAGPVPHSTPPPTQKATGIVTGYFALGGPRSGMSIIAGPLAPTVPELAGSSNITEQPAPAPFAHKPVWLHLPEHPSALVVLFDGERWFRDVDLPAALAGGPEVAIIGIGNADRADRLSTLGCDEDFIHYICGDFLEWVYTRAPMLRGLPRVIVGQSLGGISALFAHLVHPSAFDAVIAQSPSLWFEPGKNLTPASLGTTTRDWIARYSDTVKPVTDVPVYLSVGAQERTSVAHVAQLDLQWRARGWDTRLRITDGGHDYAWWYGDLLARLIELFGQFPSAPRSAARSPDR
ncbi:alpha/beta hydrolase [Corynebacterium aquatimens]|uniref:Enterochelin esterase-like enzyme n=1 Tax=Corynebacterium aquatimens TaxID=1190508 RepID=A0A931GXH8_9CORY|nr:alpha/beta hydrolase-fold protein [Corynebacterium aquatimens]MBG6121604.1 enterochelin esterase-like enzyme [Corynebacterium aquatimens]